MMTDEKKVEIFEQNRKRLFGIAYRMLGTHSDAEDVLQEAYIRWHKTDENEVQTPEAWLVTVATRLSIDRLRKVSNERETYIGPWLPEPLITSDLPTPEEELELASNLSMAFMFLLERLSPIERAAFLLRDIFDCDYQEIARIVGKSETASRQMIHRARERVRTDKPRFQSDDKKHRELIRKFTAAAAAGDEETLLSLFADDVAMVADGGGKVKTARKIIYGKAKLARTLAALGTKYGEFFRDAFTSINGEPGVLSFLSGKVFSASTFEIKDGKIAAIYRVTNPDKLQTLADLDENKIQSKNEVIE